MSITVVDWRTGDEIRVILPGLGALIALTLAAGATAFVLANWLRPLTAILTVAGVFPLTLICVLLARMWLTFGASTAQRRRDARDAARAEKQHSHL